MLLLLACVEELNWGSCLAEGEEQSRPSSETAQEEERVRVEIVEQMLSLTAPANHEPGIGEKERKAMCVYFLDKQS